MKINLKVDKPKTTITNARRFLFKKEKNMLIHINIFDASLSCKNWYQEKLGLYYDKTQIKSDKDKYLQNGLRQFMWP